MNPPTRSDEAGPAVLSEDRVYRYSLTRTWDPAKGAVMFIGLNPSTADENELDPTLRRIMGFAKFWGHGAFHMANLFAVRATQPEDMRAAPDPIGPRNDEYLLRLAVQSDLIVCAWGVHGTWMERDREVYNLLRKRGYRLMCLGLTKEGHPKHPLYMRADTQLETFRGLRF